VPNDGAGKMTPSWFALVVLTAGVFATAPGAIVLQLFFCLFGATAAFELTALGGAPVLPAVAFLPFLLRRAWTERLRPDVLRMAPAGVWLLLTVGWAVVSALVVPRLLSGTVAVKTYDRTGRDDAITVLLRPVSGNITQSAYAILDLLVFFSMRVLLAKPGLDWRVCYQSRVGPLRWIEPSTDEEIKRAGREGVPLVVAPISFVSEHSETLVELDLDYRDLAEASGVPAYHRVATVGVEPAFIGALASLVRRALSGASA